MNTAGSLFLCGIHAVAGVDWGDRDGGLCHERLGRMCVRMCACLREERWRREVALVVGEEQSTGRCSEGVPLQKKERFSVKRIYQR